ncbi:hypothetical protein RAS1_24460 [Phycisphaerae bacterium RAS1]|nr:hypothetical protein RAS1_24460 [Phycisphaerae bacterium RAS1]
MNLRSVMTSFASGLTVAAAALGGVGTPDAYVSGLLHQTLNGVSITNVQGRRLTACCLGSSGQDGVEIQLNSAWGGATAVEIQHAFVPGSEMRIRPRGWDGTIKGTVRMTGSSGGSTLTADFSDMGATSLHYEDYDANGALVGQGEFPVGGIEMIPPCINPPGSVPFWYFLATWNPNTQSWVFTLQFRCIVPGPPDDSSTNRTIVLTPGLPPGTPVLAGLASLEITGTDAGELQLRDGSLHTLGLECWGLGQGHLSETCDNPGGCTPEEITLRCDNIGSSGQDGVAIDLGHDAGSLSLRSKRCPDCPPGHVTLIKVYDNEQRVMMSAASSDNQATGATDLTLDYTGIDALEYEVVLYDENDNEIGGAFVLSGLQAIAYWDQCPPPRRATWFCQGYKCWLIACVDPMEFVLPGGGVVPGVARASFEPLNHTGSAPMRQCRVSSQDSPIELEGITVQSADGDLNCDGAVDILDINPFVLALGDPAAYSAAYPDCNAHHADVNDDDNIDVLDINPFIALLSGG